MKFMTVSIFALIALLAGNSMAADDNGQFVKSRSGKAVMLKSNRLPSQGINKNAGVAAGGAETEDKIGQFEIQDATERQKKAEETASNIVKKKEDTESGIIENMK